MQALLKRIFLTLELLRRPVCRTGRACYVEQCTARDDRHEHQRVGETFDKLLPPRPSGLDALTIEVNTDAPPARRPAERSAREFIVHGLDKRLVGEDTVGEEDVVPGAQPHRAMGDGLAQEGRSRLKKGDAVGISLAFVGTHQL